jgi:hypothetical protein
MNIKTVKKSKEKATVAEIPMKANCYLTYQTKSTSLTEKSLTSVRNSLYTPPPASTFPTSPARPSFPSNTNTTATISPKPVKKILTSSASAAKA